MPSSRAAFLVLVLSVAACLAGCAGSYEVVRIPEREADLYPMSQTRRGVTIAIDEIKGSARAKSYFGANLIREGVLPVAVVVSNYGEHPVIVKPADVLLYRGREIIDPLPVKTVREMAKSQHWFLRARTEEQIDAYFEDVMFKETPLPPKESYRGVMFFPLPKQERRASDSFLVSALFQEGGPKIRVGVTDLDTSERLHFGPFSVSVPDNNRSR